MANQCGISSAESNRVVLTYIAESPTCWSVTPVNGITRQLRITSSSLAPSKGTKTSAEIRADRMVPSIIEVEASSGGDINFELSAGSLDDFLQAFVLGTWTRPMTFDKFQGATVSITANNTVTVSGGNFTGYFTAGRVVKLEGFLIPANNDYFTVTSVNTGSGVTNIVLTTTALTVEVGNAYTKVLDANDVVVLKNTSIRLGTGGANILDSNGGNAFTAAVAAGQLLVGQRIYIEGIGYETSDITLTGLPVDGDTVTISDGVDTVIFEFDNNSAYTRGRVGVTIGADATATGHNLALAVMDSLNQRKVRVAASDALGVVTVKNLRGTGGTIAESAANLTVAAFAGGDDSKHGFATITSVSNDVIGLDREITTDANAGAAPVTIKGTHLRNPGVLSQIVKQSYTVETGFSDVSQYFVQNGLRVGSFELKVAAGDIVTGKVALQGKATATRSSTLLGSAPYTPLATTATEVLNATVNVGAIRKNGVTLSTALQSVELKGDASLRTLKGVGSKFPVGIAYGRLSITGKIVSYFETLEMYQHFINHETISLAFDFADNDFNSYTYTLPAIKITTDPIAPGGIDQDILEDLSFVSQRDPVLNTQMMIDRWSSTLPPTA